MQAGLERPTSVLSIAGASRRLSADFGKLSSTIPPDALTSGVPLRRQDYDLLLMVLGAAWGANVSCCLIS